MLSHEIGNAVIDAAMGALFTRYFNRPSSELKVSSAEFEEKHISGLFTVKSHEGIIQRIPGDHKSKYYGYIEFGKLRYAVPSKYRKIRNVSIIYSTDDFWNEPDDLEHLKKNIEQERLSKKTRNPHNHSKELIFETNLDTYFYSRKEYCIKNFLILVDGGKKGYDMFVLQTFQDALFSWEDKYSIDDEGKITSYKMIMKPQRIKRRKGLKQRVCHLNELDEMAKPFEIDGKHIFVGKGTLLFKDYIQDFNDKYNLRFTD